MFDDDGSFLSRRLRWEPEPEPEPDAGADPGHLPGYEAEAWEDEVDAGDAGPTQVAGSSRARRSNAASSPGWTSKRSTDVASCGATRR